MALLERVSTLVRANLNDLVDRAEDPEKMLKQVILDMQNQLLQVKTQVAIAIADQHVLAKKADGTRREGRRVGAARRARGGQEGRRPGPRRARQVPVVPPDGGRVRRAGGRPGGAGGEPEAGAAQPRRQARRGTGEGGPAGRPAPPRAGSRQGGRHRPEGRQRQPARRLSTA